MLDKLRQANHDRSIEWGTGSDTLFYSNEMGGECGEAQNVVKKLVRERRGLRGSRATLADLAEELADVIICVDLVAMSEGIDLWPAVVSKFNKTSDKVGLQTKL